MKHTILCVDDEVDNVDALERLFRKKYRVLKSTSGSAALEILSHEPNISLIISDQRMPEMTGVEFLHQSLNSHPQSIRILLTGYTDIDSVIAAINSGQVYRYVTKPWDPIDLTTAVDQAIDKFELTTELKNKNIELAKALTDLSTLDKAKDQFMILINHELKTPLTGVLSFLELLQETQLNTDQQKYLNRALTGSYRLKEIIDDVLKLISADSGRLPIKQQIFKLNNLKLELPERIQNSLNTKEQKLKLNLGDEFISADPSHLMEILSRLIHNASKFGNPKSDIQVESKCINDNLIEVSVTNLGPLIDESIINKIMKPFVLNENIMHHSNGLGLGLPLCQSLLKLNNSSLQFNAENGSVRISFQLPRTD